MDKLGLLTSRAPSLRVVMDALGKSVLQVLSAPAGLDIVATSPVLQDEADELPAEAGRLLLLVTSLPTCPAALQALRAAARKNYAAVVVKLRGCDPQALIDASEASRIAVLVAADSLPWHRLLALLTSALSATADGQRSAALAGADMFSLANAIAAAVGGAVAIEDAAQDVVAYSNLPDQKIDDVRQQGILARHIPELPKHADQYRQVYRAHGTIRYPSDVLTGEMPRAAIAVRSGPEILGSIWVVEGSTPLSPDAGRVLEDAARVTALYFLRTRAASDMERHTQAELLSSLLQGHGSPALVAQQIGLRKRTPFMLLGFDFLENGALPQLRPRLVREVVNYVATFGEEVASAALKSSVYVVLSPRHGAEIGARIAAGAAAQAESALRHSVRCAISTVATDPASLPALRSEVDEILRELTSDPAAPPVATAEQVRGRLLLSRLAEVAAQDARLRHSGVEALCSYDRRRETQYGQSLLAYLEAMGDAAAAGAKLAVHRNTLRYRIRRAASLFNLDLTNPDERLLIWLHLRLALSGTDRPPIADGDSAADAAVASPSSAAVI